MELIVAFLHNDELLQGQGLYSLPWDVSDQHLIALVVLVDQSVLATAIQEPRDHLLLTS